MKEKEREEIENLKAQGIIEQPGVPLLCL